MASTSVRLARLYRETVLPQARLALESSMASYQTGAVDFLSVLTNFGSVLEYEMTYFDELTAVSHRRQPARGDDRHAGGALRLVMKLSKSSRSFSLLALARSRAATSCGRRSRRASAPKARTMLYYVDAMNPAYKSDKPGMAPDGMALQPVYADEPARAGRGDATRHRPRLARSRFRPNASS